MPHNTSPISPWRRAALLTVIAACFLVPIHKCAASHEYAVVPIYEFGSFGEPYGPLVGKAGGDLYGILHTLTPDGSNGRVYKVSPEGIVTIVSGFSSTDENKTHGPFASLSRAGTNTSTSTSTSNSTDNSADTGSYYGSTTSTERFLSEGQKFFSALYQMNISGQPRIIYKFTGLVPLFSSLLAADDGNLYGVADEVFGTGTDQRFNFFAFKISTGGSGYEVLRKVEDPRGSQTAEINLDALTRSEDAPSFAPSPVQGIDGNIYVYMHSSNYSTSRSILKITPTGEITSFENMPILWSIAAGHDGNLYAFNRQAILSISTDGVLTKIHSFSASEGTPINTAPLIRGPDDSLYGVCMGADGSRTIFNITTAGKYKVIGRARETLASNVFYSLTPAENGVFYEIAGTTIDKLVPTEKHFSLNFVGSGPAKTAGTGEAEEEAGVSPSDTWANLAGANGTKPVSDEFGEKGPTVTWSAEQTGQAHVSEDTPDSHLMQGYLETKGKKEITVQVWGMPTDYIQTGYDVYVYCNGGKGVLSSHGKYAIGKTTVAVSGTSKAAFDSTYIQVDKEAGNYVLFSKFTDRSFTLTVTADEDKTKQGHAVVNGIQIVQHVKNPTLAANAVPKADVPKK